MPVDEPLTYTLDPIDRAPHLRGNDARIAALLTGGRARIVPVWRERHLITAEGARTLSYAEIAPHAEGLTFLGLMGEEPWFAAGLSGDAPPAFAGGEFRTLNEVVLLLPGDQAALLAYARAMVIWHFNHRHCGRCGAPAASTEAGHSRSCTNPACGHRSFPRTDPVVIVLITDGDRCLMGRQASWPAGMYSAIAGFVEPGETLETAVRRETFEETGITVGTVRYVCSQPWPFPASIMLGFEAEAATTTIDRKDQELEDCRWFTRAEVRGFAERDESGPGPKLPSRYAIARFLLDAWLTR